ncbi:short-chain dehydrogenase [Diplodia corticola]|uniref:Short-chain dehydrogenase n=1 Tax=Diplodia corticola TaxID=236234 RepID=A0A1J9RVJ3_9PEZI|nr:short-chain dehydrogenase [Diplodia corticola]OJD36627.1 short-chain dehydrogenase [Diplodia corticola]
MTEITIDDHHLESFKDSVVLITGGASGIGLATGLLAEKHGAKVVVGDLNPLPNDESIEGKNILYLPLDVTSWESQSAFFKKAYEKHGRIDHVFANAGVAPKANWLDEIVDEESGELQEPDYNSFAINLRGTMNTAWLALHYMKKRQQPPGGSILITSSVAGIIGFPELDYSVAKHASHGLARSLAVNLRRVPSQAFPSIRVNCLAPSWTVTSMVPAAVASLGANMQSPQAVARTAALLLADKSRHGETVLVHGGRSVEIGRGMHEGVVKLEPRLEGGECLGVLFEGMKDWATFDKGREDGEGK